MRLKRIMLITCVLLAILTIGAVSAAYDNATFDKVAIDDNADEFLTINESEGTFSDLNSLIENTPVNGVLELYDDYQNDGSISSDGITISNGITIDGKGHTLDAKSNSRIFKIESSNVTLKNIVFKNGYFNGSAGAVYWNGNPGNLINCSFENCSAMWGGAIYWNSAQGNIVNSKFINCSSLKQGDALYIWGSNLTMINSSFTNGLWNGWGNPGKIENVTVNGVLYDVSLFENIKNNDNIVLTKDYEVYTLISIDANNVVIDGNGNSIIGNANTIFALKGKNITIKNIKIKNGAISSSNTYSNIINCSFIDFNAKEGLITLSLNKAYANVKHCSFINCSKNLGEFVYISASYCTIDKCNFVNCIAEDSPNVIEISGPNNIIKECNFINSSVNDGRSILCFKDNTTVLNCNFTNDLSFVGNAIDFSYCTGCAVINCTFRNFNYLYNGIVRFYGSTSMVASVSECSFVNCYSNRSGGAINTDRCSVNIIGCNFENCNSNKTGGAISINGRKSIVSDCYFRNCVAEFGGAIYWGYTNGTVINCTFEDCSAVSDGGAIYWNATYGKIENSRFNNIKVNNGSAVYISNEDVTIADSKFVSDDLLASPVNGGKITNCTLNDVNFAKSTPEIEISAENIEFSDDAVVTAVLPRDASNVVKFTIFKNDELIRSVTSIIKDGIASYSFSGLDIGVYDVNVCYDGDGKYYESSSKAAFTVRPKVVIDQNVSVGNEGKISVDLNNDDGRIIIYIDDEPMVIENINDGKVNWVFSTNDLSVGRHIVTFDYSGKKYDKNVFNHWDDELNEYVAMEYAMDIAGKEIKVIEVTSTKDDGIVVLEFPQDATGTVEVFINGVSLTVVEIVKGIAIIDLSDYKGSDYEISFEYSGDSEYAGFTKDIQLNDNVKVSKITAGNSKVLYSSGGKYSATAYYSDGEPAEGITVTFLIGNKQYKTAKTNSEGVASIVIDKGPGSYKITSKFLSISSKKSLKVTHVVKLKSVTVKRSAKKLVLTATLGKINGKYLKNKKVAFKFNGKSYSAKTNKKGVAKITIKSNVLKKLKVGKKVTLQATYLKDTVKKTIKVKK